MYTKPVVSAKFAWIFELNLSNCGSRQLERIACGEGNHIEPSSSRLYVLPVALQCLTESDDQANLLFRGLATHGAATVVFTAASF